MFDGTFVAQNDDPDKFVYTITTEAADNWIHTSNDGISWKYVGNTTAGGDIDFAQERYIAISGAKQGITVSLRKEGEASVPTDTIKDDKYLTGKEVRFGSDFRGRIDNVFFRKGVARSLLNTCPIYSIYDIKNGWHSNFESDESDTGYIYATRTSGWHTFEIRGISKGTSSETQFFIDNKMVYISPETAAVSNVKFY